MFLLQLYPCYLPDLLSSRPLIVSGRFIGTCSGSVKVSGTLADLSSFVVDVKVQKAKDFPLERVRSFILYSLLKC
uniref:Inter-alpha-trypsin inhibitor heavy chain n=1 Tax=Solanum tuberosum TaxID=4113 RepID=M1C3H4_SOLTU